MNTRRTYTMDGEDVVMTTQVFDDDDVEIEKTVSRQGNREIVLEQITKQAAEAKAERDGLTAAGDEQPIPPTGKAGAKENVYFIRGKQAFKTEIQRNGAGQVAQARTRVLGQKSQALEHAVERYNEIEEMRSGIEKAK